MPLHPAKEISSAAETEPRSLRPLVPCCRVKYARTGCTTHCFLLRAPDWNRTSFSAFSEPRTNHVCYQGMCLQHFAPATRIELARSAVTGQRPHQWTSQAIGVTYECRPRTSCSTGRRAEPLHQRHHIVRLEGVEPSLLAHQASSLPLRSKAQTDSRSGVN